MKRLRASRLARIIAAAFIAAALVLFFLPARLRPFNLLRLSMSPVDRRFAREATLEDPVDLRKYNPCLPDSCPNGCMVRVPGGTFVMGAQHIDPKAPLYDKDAADDEAPPHKVSVSPYWIHHDEVLSEQLVRCILDGACRSEDMVRTGGLFNSDRRLHPANGVTWRGASDYCKWIGGRLPTEAEWEFAARGKDGRRFPWGDTPLPSCPNTTWNNGCGEGGTGSMKHGTETPFGVFALVGSVWEWTADWYDPGYYAVSPRQNPAGPPQGTEKVIRGGGWMTDNVVELRSAYRAHSEPTAQMPDIGFRCVRPTKP